LAKPGQRSGTLLPLALIGGLSVAVGITAYSRLSNSEFGLPSTRRSPAPPAISPTINGQASVIDGDTIEIHRARIRLFGIDAPEGSQTCTIEGKAWACGRRAAFALSDKIGMQTVECRPKDRDRFGRTVAVCMVAGEDVNAWMVEQGWALAYRRYSLDYVNQERWAANAKRGMWQGEFEAPEEWRRNHSDRTRPRSVDSPGPPKPKFVTPP